MIAKSTRLGKINIIWGQKNSRYPYCNSIYVKDKTRTLIDPAAGLETLQCLANERIVRVVNSHYLFDHIRYNYLFKNACIQVHEYDKDAMSDVFKFAEKYGALRIQGEFWIRNLIRILNREKEIPDNDESFTYDRSFYSSIGKVSATYSDGDVLSLGSESIEIMHIPGHADSMCCFYFPSVLLCYVSDYNVLAEWGPWYGGEDSDIQELVESAEKIKSIIADYFVTAHDPVVLERKDFIKYLSGFLATIEERHDRILQLIGDGLDFSEISNYGLFYKKKFLSHPWVRVWETMMLIKHLEYLKLFQFIPAAYQTKVSQQ